MSDSNGLVGCFGPSERFLLDCRTLEDGLIDSSRHPAEWFLSLCADVGISPVPVVGIDVPPALTDAVSRSLRRLNTGASIRLRGDTILSGGSAVTVLLRRLDLPRSEVDLVLDAGRPPFGQTAIYAELLARGLRTLEPLSDWRSVTVCAGTFPEDLGQHVDYESHGTIARTELDLYMHTKSCLGSPELSFGDYGVVAPEDHSGGRSGAANIRYARSHDWLVVRGHRLIDSKPDPSDYPHQAGVLRQMVSTFDRNHCSGCEFIASRSSHHPGNAGQWRSAGFSHHFARTIDQLDAVTTAA